MIRNAFVLCLVLGLTNCTSIGQSSAKYSIQPRDLQDQINTGDGERLAKAVPGRPIMVNNGLVFSVPGNAVLGIAMAVGAIKSSVEALSNIDEFELVSALEEEISGTPTAPTMLEPYCYLFGHPTAYVEARIRVVTETGDKTISWRSERKTITGGDSWSDNNGSALIDACRFGVKKLAKQLD